MNNTNKFLFYLKTSCPWRKPLLLLVMAGSTLFLQAQTALWTGGGNGSDWDDAANWFFSGGGGFNASTEFTIPCCGGPSTASGSSITTGMLIVNTGGTATVPAGFTINVDATLFPDDGLRSDGSFTNNGTVNISNSVGDGLDIQNGTFDNNAGATINLNDIGADALDVDGGTFNNSGNVNIGQTGNITQSGIENNSTVNHNGGQIIIDNTGDPGIMNEPGGTFTNMATIDIGQNGGASNIASIGIRNENIFNNNGGAINIDNTLNDGVRNYNNTFTNGATLNIGQNGPATNIDDEGIDVISGTFTNNGTVKIDNTGGTGVRNAGTINNSSTLDIGQDASLSNIGNHGFENTGTLNNNSGTVQIDNTAQKGFLNNGGTITNLANINIGKNGGASNIAKDGLDNSSGDFNNNGGELYVANANGDGIDHGGGTFTNAANIKIGQSAGNITNTGLLVGSTFNNNSGEITIDNIGENGLHVLTPAVFTNEATVTIGINGGADNITGHGLLNASTFDNENAGVVNVSNTFLQGVHNEGTFNNRGTMNLGQTGGPGNVKRNPLDNDGGTFNNESTGFIDIDNSAHDGIANFGGPFNNNGGTIQIDNCGNRGVLNNATFNNNSNGQLFIGQNGGNIGDEGIFNESFLFTNEATIIIDDAGRDGFNNWDGATFNNINGGEILIGQSSSIGGSGIEINSGTVTNGSCSTVKIAHDFKNFGSFTNDGLFVVNTTESHNTTGGTTINNGIIEYFQGNPIPGVTNNEIIVEPVTEDDCIIITPAFDLGGTVDFNIIGVYTDASGNNSAGSYDVGTNTFTANPALAEGTHTLYVKIEDTSGSGCTRIVAWELTTQNCCTPTTYYADTDSDGYGDPDDSVSACNPPAGYVSDDTDCDDTNANINPGESEVCNDVDDDCNGLVDDGLAFDDYYLDGDGDGYGAGTPVNDCQSPGAGYVTQDGDCDDADANVNPGESEVCNDVDDDCNGLVDDGLAFDDYYLDGDGDGYGAGTPVNDCQSPGAGYVTQDGDCDDADANVNPGATETCNDIDDDCNGLVDDGLAFDDYYLDGDGDGYGAGTPVNDCQSPGAGYVTQDGDCDDADANVNPGATEICNDIDDDCNGLVDDGVVFEDYYLDGDGDGFGAGSPTNDCQPPSPDHVTNNDDCDDADANVNPNATETCNDVDDDCNGLVDDGLAFDDYYLDGDGDGYGAGTPVNDCQSPGAGYVTQDGDCDDADANVNPGATETCNDVDDDCNGLVDDGLAFDDYYLDGDGDGYGAGTPVNDCQSPGAGYVTQDGDCDDADANVNPGATETCNDIDDDCNGLVDDGLAFDDYYLDGDGDGYGAGTPVNDCQSPGAGYVTQDGDCDDADANVNPGATEICNDIDDDCNGLVDDGVVFEDYYLDGDGDGFGAGSPTNDCQPPSPDHVTNNDDCDDADANVNPNATETCNDVDDDCNGLVDDGLAFDDYYLDGDGDGYGAGTPVNDCQSPGAGYVTQDGDCDDADANVNPGATETCNDVDDDCNGLVDDGLAFDDYYLDGDGDGYGAGTPVNDCQSPGAGYVTQDGDCDDADANVNPGATETCNDIDDDCNGLVDDGLAFDDYYLDGDGDGYGAGTPVNDCQSPGAGYVTQDGDCDDADANVNPGATEICNDIDDDCNGLVDDGVVFEDYYLDGDGDGFGAGSPTNDCQPPSPDHVTNNDDCDDADANVNPNATETCNDVDDDCNGLVDDGLAFDDYYLDGDGDGYGAGTPVNDCQSPGAGYVTQDGDCDDADANVNPGATEICNDIDDDCNGLVDDGVVFEDYYLDGDGDGFGAGSPTNDCQPPSPDHVTNNDDCDDADANVNPNATETCNDVDDDCNGLVDDGLAFDDYYLDGDGDGYGAGTPVNDCQSPGAGYVTQDGDCDDADANVNPGATEVCNDIDDDCNGLVDDGVVTQDWYLDDDDDGYGAGTPVADCQSPGPDYVLEDGDCDDTQFQVNPGATEVCNGIDDDCNGLIDDGAASVDWYLDGDDDGYGAGTPVNDCQAPGPDYVQQDGDCNDNDATVNPGVSEICNGIDDDCNGLIDDGLVNQDWYLDADSDTYGAGTPVNDCQAPGPDYVLLSGDCDDADAAVNPGATEVCNDIDDDCNGLIDDGLVNQDWYLDADSDTYGAGTPVNDCQAPGPDYVLLSGDCDDADAAVNPGAAEVCNDIDDDCNGLIDDGLVTQDWYLDNDGDNYGTGTPVNDCQAPGPNYALQDGDCDDTDASINPGAAEDCNGIDDNCNGQVDEGLTNNDWFLDDDGDGYGAGAPTASCVAPGPNYVLLDGDCDDNDADINPGATDVCNGEDDNCNGIVDDGPMETYTGNLLFDKQSEVDDWLTCYDVIDGNLTITGSDISNLATMVNLVEVTGNVTIQFTELTDISGLVSLADVGGTLTIYFNSSLTSLTGLESLAAVGGNFLMYYNFSLADCCAVYDLLDNSGVTGVVVIFFNATGCNSEQEILDDCSGTNLVAQPGNGLNDRMGAKVQKQNAVGTPNTVETPDPAIELPVLAQLSTVHQVTVYPNPSNGSFTVDIPVQFETGKISILDIHGRQVTEREIALGQYSYQFRNDRLTPGIYMVVLRSEGEPTQAKRLVIE